MNIKLKKYLSNAGYCSRRNANQFIEDNLIKINSEIASSDSLLKHGDIVLINHKKEIVDLNPKTDILIYHKPTGQICSSIGTDNNQSVFEFLPKRNHGKWIMVGRLDVNTSGLLIFSNNGDLVQKLSHPSSMIERKYLCRIYGIPNEELLKKLIKGVTIDGKESNFDKLEALKNKPDSKNTWFKVTLHSGRNREVRKLWESQSLQVNRLIRTGFGPIILPKELKKGKHSYLSTKEIHDVLDLLNLNN